VAVASILDFIQKMSQDPQSAVEEHSHLGEICVGTNLLRESFLGSS
jgi:hypothetical protein